MKIILNGLPYEISGGKDEKSFPVGKLLGQLNINPDSVAVEINGRIISRKDFASTTLREGDIVEIIRFMGGG